MVFLHAMLRRTKISVRVCLVGFGLVWGHVTRLVPSFVLLFYGCVGVCVCDSCSCLHLHLRLRLRLAVRVCLSICVYSAPFASLIRGGDLLF